MTLIVTSISNLGIIQASDSNLTVGGGGTMAGPKVFSLGFTPAALSLAGTYSVGGVPMDVWMPQCIADYGAMPGATLEGFADYLGRRLTNEITDAERNNGSLIHIAGYVPRKRRIAPGHALRSQLGSNQSDERRL